MINVQIGPALDMRNKKSPHTEEWNVEATSGEVHKDQAPPTSQSTPLETRDSVDRLSPTKSLW